MGPSGPSATQLEGGSGLGGGGRRAAVRPHRVGTEGEDCSSVGRPFSPKHLRKLFLNPFNTQSICGLQAWLCIRISCGAFTGCARQPFKRMRQICKKGYGKISKTCWKATKARCKRVRPHPPMPACLQMQSTMCGTICKKTC